MKPTNQTVVKIYKAAVLFFILLALCADCACSPKLKRFIHQDYMNPCGHNEFSNADECANWKKNYPKEYEKYQKRNAVKH